jgi:predicted transcriptional regulator
MVGNPTKFDKYDILKCLLLIDEDVSRTSLLEALDRGEGSVRAILDILKQKGFISSNRQGHSLTKKGIETKNRISNLISLKKCNLEIFPGQKAAFIIRTNKTLELGYAERDLAIKNGADAALILQYKDGFKIPGGANSKALKKLFDFQNKDVLLITAAPKQSLAERAGLVVCAELIPELEKVVNSFY